MAKFDLAAAMGLQSVSKLDTDTKMIDLSLIDPHPGNFFEVESDITDLAESIELNGLLQPLVVTPSSDGRYRTIAGHRRRMALLKLAEDQPEKWQRVPCMVTHPASPELEELALIQTNTEAREIGWAEKTKAATRVEAILVKLQQEQGVKLPGKMRTNVAKIIKTSESQIARAKFINENLCNEAKKLNLNDSTAYKLSHLPKTDQRALVDHYKNDSWRLTTSAIKAYQDNISEGKDPFEVRQTDKSTVRDCYVQPMEKNRYKKCDHSAAISSRNERDDLPNWARCENKVCCNYCSYRFDCKDVCKHCAANIKKERNTETYSIGQRLRKARIDVNMSVKDASEKMEISTDLVLNHETNRSCSASEIKKYCDIYGCTPNYIFGYDVSHGRMMPNWNRLHLDSTPEDGQLCMILSFEKNPITIDGKIFCSTRPAIWKNGRFVSALNENVRINGILIGWFPIPEPPDGYTISIGKNNGSDDE